MFGDTWNRWQVRFLLRAAPPIPKPLETIYDGKSKLAMLFGEEFLAGLKGRTVLDFGCGEGSEVIEMAAAGARLVMGLENRESMLEIARRRAADAGLSTRCRFTAVCEEPVDVVVSLDCFEHFAEPEAMLGMMYDLLKPGGVLFASWGPPWFHPNGSHLIELPPWTHVFFTERAVMEWRSHMRDDGARRYADGGCGLNQMTIAAFEKMVKRSRFRIEYLRTPPIRRLRFLHNRWTREFTTSVVQCKLLR